MSDLRDHRLLATEWKVVIDRTLSAEVAAWAAGRLAPDPHATSPDGDGYRTTTVYFDTPARDVLERRGSYGRSKYRVRRYGASPSAFLERKLRTRDRLSKRRTEVPLEDIAAVLAPRTGARRPGAWFADRLQLRGLAPVCVLRYDRVARVGMGAAGPYRLTIDADLRGALTPEVVLEVDDHALTPVLPHQAVLELKFVREVPPVFKALFETFRITPAPFSKYRYAVPRLATTPETSCLAS